MMADQQETGEKASDSSDEETFEDAPGLPSTTASYVQNGQMDLMTSIKETSHALDLFLNNKFSEAKEMLQPWAEQSMYHALGHATLMYLQAALTFDMADIDNAVKTVKNSMAVCDKFRKKQSMIGSLTRSRSHYESYTEEEIHAELCYAECLIERALLTFIQDENLISFVKGSLKIRACYQSYKECSKILTKYPWKQDQDKSNFESGVRMGIGLFNLMISLLPTKILKLLEFVGFSGNKALGLSELEKGAQLQGSLRGPLCTLALLGYHTVMTYVLGTADGDIELCERLLQPCLTKYPKGALFLFFAGRIEEIKGNINSAVLRFEESIETQSEWRQFHHLCYWELMWCHSFNSDWLLAMKYAEKLCRESRWSRSTYTYQKAAFLMMCDDRSEETEAHIEYLMQEAPRLKQRIAGKSIPIEKFAVKKAARYFEQNKRLTLPALELIYVWNGFMIIGKNEKLIEPLLNMIEAELNLILANKDKYEHYNDDYCLALLLKGTCLKHLKRDFQAEQCFREVWQHEKLLKHDTYLVPYALMELSLLFLNSNLEEANNMLHKAKYNYKRYALESRLHFRIHAANTKIKALMSLDENEDSAEQFEDTLPGSSSVDEMTPTPPPSPTPIDG